MSQESDCFLCSDLSDRDGSIVLTRAFRLAADIAPLSRDHCLFYTTEHSLSFSQLSESLLREAARILVDLSTLPMFKGRELLYFEHGPSHARLNTVGCCDHAHIHILPTESVGRAMGGEVTIDRYSLLKKDEREGRIKFTRTLRLEELENLTGENYFWMANNLQSLDAFLIVRPERQYLRRVAARLLGQSMFQTWDLYDDMIAWGTTQKLRAEIGDRAEYR